MQLFLKLLLQILAVGMALTANVLDYVTHDRRTRKFRRYRWVLFATSVVFLAASALLIIVDDQQAQQQRSDLEKQVERARQPIHDVYVSYRIDFPISHPALAPYMARVNAALDESAKAHEGKGGLSASNTRPDGSVISMQILPQGPLFPDQNREPLPYFLFNYTGLQLHFYVAGNHNYTDPSKSDLMFNVETLVDNSVPQLRENADALSALHIDLERNVMFVAASDWRVPAQRSRFTGRLQSIPELLSATLVVRYESFASSYHDIVQNHLRPLQQQAGVEFVAINVAGRHLRFSREQLNARLDSKRERYYVVPVARATDPAW